MPLSRTQQCLRAARLPSVQSPTHHRQAAPSGVEALRAGLGVVRTLQGFDTSTDPGVTALRESWRAREGGE